MKQSNVALVNMGELIVIYHGEEPIGTVSKKTLRILLDEKQDIERVESFLPFDPEGLKEELKDEA